MYLMNSVLPLRCVADCHDSTHFRLYLAILWDITCFWYLWRQPVKFLVIVLCNGIVGEVF